MPLAPGVKKDGQKLHVHSHPWVKPIWYIARDGKRVEAKNYEECREYARSHGFAGIRITS